MFAKFFSKFSDLSRGGPFRSIHAKGEAKHNRGDLPLVNYFKNTWDGLRFSAVDCFNRVCADSKLIGRGESNAGVSVIDGEDGMGHLPSCAIALIEQATKTPKNSAERIRLKTVEVLSSLGILIEDFQGVGR